LSEEKMHGAGTEQVEIGSVVALLVDRHGSKWLRFIRRVLHNPADAEDVLQESIRRVLSQKRALASDEEVRMYLNRVIANTAIDLYHERKRERSKQTPLLDTLCLAPPCTEPQWWMEEEEDSARHEVCIRLVREGLAALPPKQYEALRLTVLEPGAVSIRDAGSSSGIPYSTLRHRARQGIRRLRRLIHQKAKM
jgi:RNA polymerase sigma-70 factor, ECF subfamily